MKYRVLKITNNVEKYPECKEDTKEFPDLVNYVKDEMELIIMNERDDWVFADEFFFTHTVKEFNVEGE